MSVDYGYGDAAPDTTDYGYGDAAPDSADYGYGDAAPDSGGADEADEQHLNGDAAANDADKYGYGDASPNDDADKYGYGDASPNDDADKYGYGDASPNDTATHHEYEIGLNDGANSDDKLQPKRNPPNRTYSADDSTAAARRKKEGGRYRRRGSVTKFSLSTADTVKTEYAEHEDLINKFRSEAQVSNHSNASDSVEFSDSGESNDNLDETQVAAKKKMKKASKRFMKFGGRRGSK